MAFTNNLTKQLTIKGNVLGTVTGKATTVKVLGSIFGGEVDLFDAKNIFIGGSIVGTDGKNSGQLNVVQNIQTVASQSVSITVKGSLVGADTATWMQSDDNGVRFENAGAINVRGSVRSILIGGDIISGEVASGTAAVNGGIMVTHDVGSITIGGSIFGNDKTPVNILAGGQSQLPATGDHTAIGKLTVKGHAIHAYIATGTSVLNGTGNPSAPKVLNYTTTNPDAGIGSIKIGGNFVNSNIFTGVDDTGLLGVNPTASADTLAMGDASKTAKLGPVIIKGHLLSDFEASSYSGFAADVIASITVAGRKVFTAGDGLRNFDTYITAKEL